MNRTATLAFAVLSLCLLTTTPAVAVTLRASNATVSGAGQTATICIDLETEGEQVAGTQNELVWDTTCATLSGLLSCEASSGLGKKLHASFPNGDGLPPLRAFVFSMSDVSPMPDTELYCCDFTSELVSPGSCPISVQATRASDPNGRGLSASGVAGSIVLPGAGGGGGGGGGGVSGPVSGAVGGAPSGGGATGGGVAGGGATGGGATGGGAAGGVVSGLGQAPSQVLPGGVPGEQPVDTQALAEAAGETARQEAERIIERQIPAGGSEEKEPEGAEVTEGEEQPTERPTSPAAAPTSPAPQATTPARGTPTAKAPTVGRTPAAAPAQQAKAKEESSSWFSCQITTGGSRNASVLLVIGVIGLLVNRIRRKPRG